MMLATHAVFWRESVDSAAILEQSQAATSHECTAHYSRYEVIQEVKVHLLVDVIITALSIIL